MVLLFSSVEGCTVSRLIDAMERMYVSDGRQANVSQGTGVQEWRTGVLYQQRRPGVVRYTTLTIMMFHGQHGSSAAMMKQGEAVWLWL